MLSCKHYVNSGDSCGHAIVSYREFLVRLVVFCEDLRVAVDAMMDKPADPNINVNECKARGGFFCLPCEN